MANIATMNGERPRVPAMGADHFGAQDIGGMAQNTAYFRATVFERLRVHALPQPAEITRDGITAQVLSRFPSKHSGVVEIPVIYRAARADIVDRFFEEHLEFPKND